MIIAPQRNCFGKDLFMSENVFVVKFSVESEACQAFPELKNAVLTND